MSDHPHYEELAALAAGWQLNDEELSELQKHSEVCTQCKSSFTEFRELVHFGLPLAERRPRLSLSTILGRPGPGATDRFVRRASAAGIAFSPAVTRLNSSPAPYLSLGAVAGVLATLLIAFLYGSPAPRPASQQGNEQNTSQAQQQLEQLKGKNSALDTAVSQLQRSLSEQQRASENLRAQVARLTAAANNSRHDDALQAEIARSARVLEDTEARAKTQEKLLADTKAELARVTEAHASDQASMVADQVRINELSEQLKTTAANIDMDRQLASAGKDVRDLMGARQLHVVDVRDTLPNGKSGKAFGRVFLTEGKSLIFYAFDLTDAKRIDAKQTFQVWGQQEGKPGSPRSLGFLYVDDKAQRRWALKTEDPAAVREIDSVFVTLEPEGGAKKPSGQRLLYAYLGEANHP